jgi:DNA segregation ATPase FtsK/SpoIIIE, S-DNA-T family
MWCVAGESVSISPAVVFPVTNQAGRNMLLVGAEDAMAAAVMHVATVSFVRSVRAKGLQPAVVTIQGAKPTDAKALTLPQLWKTLPCSFTSFDIRGDKEGVAPVHQLLQARMADSAAQADPLLLNIVQLGRLRNLKRDEEFSFGQSEVSADKMLEEVLRDGPSHSIHVMIWAESYSTVNRWLSRSALREMEIRLLMQMSANDSSNLVDSVAASKLGEHVMLLYDEATGQEQKFRPYSMDSLQDLQNWVSP